MLSTSPVPKSRLTGRSHAASFNYASPFMFAMLPALFAACLGFEGQGLAGRLATSLGGNTMGIYFVHTIVIAWAGTWCSVAGLGLPMRLLVLAGVGRDRVQCVQSRLALAI